MDLLLDIFVLLFLDVILSIDNAILIASITRNLDEKSQRVSRIIGASLAVLLRLIFVILVLLVLTSMSSIPGIYIIGGIILCIIGIMITNQASHAGEEKNAATSIAKAIALIMAGDIMLSFDNSFIIADISLGMEVSMWLTIVIITIALLLSLIILLFFSKQLAQLMLKHPWIIFIASWLLVSVGIELLLKDHLFDIDEKWHLLCMFVSYAIGGIIVGSKWAIFDRKNQKENA